MKLKIREVRESKGIRLSELSRLSGVSVSFLSEVESNKKSITIEKLCLVAKALNVKPEELYEC